MLLLAVLPILRLPWVRDWQEDKAGMTLDGKVEDGRVHGIGGLFFRARDPEGLNAWYRTHLGVGAGCSGTDEPAGEWLWNAAGGQTVFAPFKHDTDYFAADKAFMINFRVSGLDALVARLAEAGIPAERRAEWDNPAVGRFARIHDPEGNAIELWEPLRGNPSPR